MRLDHTDSDTAPLGRPTDHLELIESARQLLEMSEEELRIAHWGCGGDTRTDELAGFLAGVRPLSDSEYNILAAAINDRLIAADAAPSIPYLEDGE